MLCAAQSLCLHWLPSPLLHDLPLLALCGHTGVPVWRCGRGLCHSEDLEVIVGASCAPERVLLGLKVSELGPHGQNQHWALAL